jgi:hypothetical protein
MTPQPAFIQPARFRLLEKARAVAPFLIFAHILGIRVLTFATERDQLGSRRVTGVRGDCSTFSPGLGHFLQKIGGFAMSYMAVLAMHWIWINGPAELTRIRNNMFAVGMPVL